MAALDDLMAEAGARIITQPVQGKGFTRDGITWDVLRTDLIHPVCSGNKLFKLYPYLAEAIQNGHTRVRTFGGAWSNHILATAYAAGACGLRSTGFIRGQEPVNWSSTLREARDMGMDLVFLDRNSFDDLALRDTAEGEAFTIPMGGYGPKGAEGASKMLEYTDTDRYSHIFCATGTGTMLAGLALAAGNVRLGAVNVVRGHDPTRTLSELAPGKEADIYDKYDFGAYARADVQLLDFMNLFFMQNRIPTDIIYTGKLMFAIHDLMQQDAFARGSRILAIHSGGLQGNNSLKKGQVIF